MPQARTEQEREYVRNEATAFLEAVTDHYDDRVETNQFINDEYGDVMVRFNTRDIPTGAGERLDLGPLFALAHRHHFRPCSGTGEKFTDIGTANTSVDITLYFSYTFPPHTQQPTRLANSDFQPSP